MSNTQNKHVVKSVNLFTLKGEIRHFYITPLTYHLSSRWETLPKLLSKVIMGGRYALVIVFFQWYKKLPSGYKCQPVIQHVMWRAPSTVLPVFC
uniref:Uncharacterized protein n=1 Tax=Pyxicephalus adspersus TaxID=30357 RepID=A0AAV3AGX7_PYXAD|nr:TPA: hypothetical protein GDO54_010186 [Pyxicephalus adspersus]